MRVVDFGAQAEAVEHLDDGPMGAIHQLNEVYKNSNICKNKIDMNE
jgi:hypothetical protein